MNKRIILRIIALLTAVTLLFPVGCNSFGKTISSNDYPIPVNEEEETVNTENTETASDVTVEKENDISELDAEALKPEPNSLKESGKYVFNPRVIPQGLANDYLDNPKIVRIAKMLLDAVYHMEPEIVFEGPDAVSEEDIDTAIMVASLACPLMNAASISTVDGTTYNISYFDTISLTDISEEGDFNFGSTGVLESSEALSRFEDFIDYVTCTINDNITPENTQAECAQIIYEQLIKDMELDLNYLNNVVMEEMKVGEVVYVAGENITHVNERKLNIWEFNDLYIFMLNQLQIEVVHVTTSGTFPPELTSEYEALKQADGWWDWLILALDGQYYHADLAMDKLKYDKENGSGDPDLAYFGLSDESRSGSFRFNKASMSVISGYYEPKEFDIPECPNDYDF